MTEDTDNPTAQGGNSGDPAGQAEFSTGDGRPPASLAAALEKPPEPVIVDDDGKEFETVRPLPYPIVAIGASAGGVEAYIELFGSLAPDTGMAFVIVPHLLADHKSHLADILSRHTPMPVKEITNNTRPEQNHVYILPPNMRARMENGIFQLEARVGDGVPRPIDYFFRSLATDQKSRSIGVVLSGTDADG